MSTKIHTVSVGERLKAMHIRGQLGWDRVAKLLEISVSMLHQVKSGRRNLSDKALHRLHELEKKIAEADDEQTALMLRGLSVSVFGKDIYENENAGFDPEVKRRLACLQKIIEACTDAELKGAFDLFNKMAEKDELLGKIFEQVANVISCTILRRMGNKNPSSKDGSSGKKRT